MLECRFVDWVVIVPGSCYTKDDGTCIIKSDLPGFVWISRFKEERVCWHAIRIARCIALMSNIVAVESAPLGRGRTGIDKVKFLRGRNRLVIYLGK